MIDTKTAIITVILIKLVAYIALGTTIKKRFVSPIFDFECNFLINFLALVWLNWKFEKMSILRAIKNHEVVHSCDKYEHIESNQNLK